MGRRPRRLQRGGLDQRVPRRLGSDPGDARALLEHGNRGLCRGVRLPRRRRGDWDSTSTRSPRDLAPYRAVKPACRRRRGAEPDDARLGRLARPGRLCRRRSDGRDPDRTRRGVGDRLARHARGPERQVLRPAAPGRVDLRAGRQAGRRMDPDRRRHGAGQARARGARAARGGGAGDRQGRVAPASSAGTRSASPGSGSRSRGRQGRPQRDHHDDRGARIRPPGRRTVPPAVARSSRWCSRAVARARTSPPGPIAPRDASRASRASSS